MDIQIIQSLKIDVTLRAYPEIQDWLSKFWILDNQSTADNEN
ncbi:hypothetical protein SDC9_106576 [bioreactor metagenome]|uniref:Uncharacterized protein n=1 Tax=bioreactor metagenome TaxID=1076179 RepID=A0A645B2P5_9ZZZZ